MKSLAATPNDFEAESMTVSKFIRKLLKLKDVLVAKNCLPGGNGTCTFAL